MAMTVTGRVGILCAAALAATVAGGAPASARVMVDVDLTGQTMHVTRGDGTTADWDVSSGAHGLETPIGTYGVTWMDADHKSRKYHSSPMPHSIFFHEGYAIHGTTAWRRLGEAASHGCVRLSDANAATLYGWVKAEGATIRISGRAPSPGEATARRFAPGAETFAEQEERPYGPSTRYEGPSDDPTPRTWRRRVGDDGFRSEAPDGW